MDNSLVVFDKLKADITLFAKPCFDVAIVDQASCDAAIVMGKEVKSWSKKVEDKRTEMVKPLNDHVKTINTYAKQITDPLDKAEAHIKAQMKAFQIKLEAERQKELKRIEDERKTAEAEAARKLAEQKAEAESVAMFMSADDAVRAEIVAEAESERTHNEIATVHKLQTKEANNMKVSGSRKVWKFDLVDFSKIPREYLTLSETAVREAIKNEVREIPGLNIYQDVQVSL